MEEANKNRFLNITVMLTVVPAYIYFTSFIYEQGSCSRYGIPSYLIDPNLTTILLFATTIFVIFFSSLKLLGFSMPFFKAAKDESRKHFSSIFGINGFCVIIIVLMLYAYPISWTLIFILLGVTAFLNLTTWGLSLILKAREKKSLKEKLEEIHTEKDDIDIVSPLMEKLAKQEKLFIMILILVPIISFFFGDGQSLKQKNYQTLYTIPNVVVLKKYNDLLICSSFNRTRKILSDSLILIKISDNQPVILKSENIGPLTLK